MVIEQDTHRERQTREMERPFAKDASKDTLAALLTATHRDQLALCRSLEAIADSLPSHVDRAACLNAARALGPLISRAHDLEERLVFPAIEARHAISASIERLKYEHMEDVCFSEELHDALMAYGRGSPRPAPDAFGYMLRGFFEGLRRHIAFEQEIIVPLLEEDT